MALYFCLIRSIVCQQNCIHEFLFMCRVCPERCIKLPKFSSWEPFVQQLNDAISLINTESKRVLIKTKINVFNQISFMKFNTNFFFGKLPQLIKGCIIIISTHNIIRRNCKIRNSSIIEYLNIYGTINYAFLVFNNCNYCIKDLIIFYSYWFITLNSIHELKKNWAAILIERIIGVRIKNQYNYQGGGLTQSIQ